MANLTQHDLNVVHTAFEQINELFDEIEPSDDLLEAVAAAEEVAESLAVGGQIDTGDVESLRDALAALRSEIGVDEIDSLDYEISDALDELEELLRTVATPAPVLAPVRASSSVNTGLFGEDELSQAI